MSHFEKQDNNWFKTIVFNVLKSVPHIVSNDVRDFFSQIMFKLSSEKIALEGVCEVDQNGIPVPTLSENLSDKISPEIAKKPLVMFVGGAFDGSYSYPSIYKTVSGGLFPKYYSENNEVQDVCYSTWKSSVSLDIIRAWSEAGQKICLIGHSWGGDTALEIAEKLSEEGVEIDLLCTIDPVSFDVIYGGIQKPTGVKNWINISVDYNHDSLSNFANIPAITGGFWGDHTMADMSFIASSAEIDGEHVIFDHSMAEAMFYHYLNNTVQHFHEI